MKAAVNKVYGSPDVVKVIQVDKPVPKEDEILIKVFATTVNRTDCGFRSAEYFISRFFSGMFRPKYRSLGNEFAGVVEGVGTKVKSFKIGDKVFGYNDVSFGSHSEYTTIGENGAVTTIPGNLTFEEAAPILEGAHYALSNIRAAKVKPGQDVLLNGATGGIGSAAVQLLKHFGAKVTAVCNTKNITLIQSLGADTIIDYTREDFTQIDQKFNFIFDAVGKSSFGKCKPLLKENGIYISTELGKNCENILLSFTTPVFGNKKLLFPIPSISKEDVIFLRGLVESGKYRPVVDRCYPLEEIVEAYKYVETGQKTGNVVIAVC